MKSEQEKKPHPFPEMVEIWKANREHCTAAAIIEEGEVVSGSMPGDDYKLAWIDADNYLNHGTNKQVFYKIYHSVDEIDEEAIKKLLKEAVELDKQSGKKK